MVPIVDTWAKRGRLGTRTGSAWLGQAGGWPRPMATTMPRRVGQRLWLNRHGRAAARGEDFPCWRARVPRLETRQGCRMAGESTVVRFAAPTVDSQKTEESVTFDPELSDGGGRCAPASAGCRRNPVRARGQRNRQVESDVPFQQAEPRACRGRSPRTGRPGCSLTRWT